jgi:proliferating cell nuclear antigen
LKSDKDNLIIKIKGKDKKKTTYSMKLVDLEQEKRKNMELIFDKKIVIPGDEFHKLCKEMNVFAEYISINCNNKNIKFSCSGISTSRETVYKNGEDNIEIIDSNNKINKGMYEIKNIQLFNKCINLSENFSFYMRDNFPLLIIYTIENIGTINVALSPIQEEDLNNILYSYSDDEDELELKTNNDNQLFDED